MTALPVGWTRSTLAEVAHLSSGGTPQAKNPRYYGGDIPWAVIGDLNDGLVTETAQSITQDGLENSSAKVVGVDTILLAMYGSIGKLGITGVPMATNQAIAAIKPSGGVDVRYLYYYLLSQRRELGHQGKGATQQNISQTVLKPWPVPYPTDIDEQHRIVELLEDHLSRLDAATASLRDSLCRLGVLRRLVVKEIAVGDSVPLKQLAIDSGYGTSVKCEVGGAGPAVVRIPNLVGGRINLTDEKRAIDPSVDLSSSMLVLGDVLIIRTNGSKELIGRSGVVQEGVDAAFASYLIRYQVDADRIRPEWLHAMLGSPLLRAEIERLAASSAGQHNLSLGKLDSLPIPTPTLEDQDAALACLADLDDHLGALRQALNVSLRRGESLRRSLLAAAFSGRLTAEKSVGALA